MKLTGMDVKRVTTKLTKKDILGAWAARWGINRNNYMIEPGLYAVGSPDKESPVLVSSNYKLTFDMLRKELEGLSLWIMVLDTKGINVWCAAGKGTFSTEEIINRIKETKLTRVVSNKTLILPQLGAPGVEAHKITKLTGFKIIYGPIRANDIKEFLNNDFKTSEHMRSVKFNLWSRLVLTPLETIQAMKYYPIIILILFIMNFVKASRVDIGQVIFTSVINSIPFLISILVGTILVPIMLPIIPFRSFAIKGLTMGVLWVIIFINLSSVFLFKDSIFNLMGNMLLFTSITTYLGLNFTGSTTYTCFSGVVKETLWTVPIVILMSIIGLVFLAIGI